MFIIIIFLELEALFGFLNSLQIKYKTPKHDSHLL